eukprot:gnl/MRDRNA2_/MRDRNA2_14416_c0_seq1.p1 gnl/MRDRNA2_/MRDRNA2_14416_c0~~gnl/MRDRNA2_/MRDRNA2_14416_c0_seq1.p1  ORF type:complete len:105 (-),score=2.02 gnl/MRDRNA2_/MRDRNA2_14416_c0_seq1:256-540(-)
MSPPNLYTILLYRFLMRRGHHHKKSACTFSLLNLPLILRLTDRAPSVNADKQNTQVQAKENFGRIETKVQEHSRDGAETSYFHSTCTQPHYTRL